jgi:site-specific DNA-adenine methylase
MKGIIPYFGGKSRLVKTIINKIPEHACYVEVFAGGASVFFGKDPSTQKGPKLKLLQIPFYHRLKLQLFAVI